MRVFFKNGKQREFFDKILNLISIKEAAGLCGFSERTIRDWHRGKFLANLMALHKMCKKTEIRFPSNVELKNDYWYVVNGSLVGGLAVYKKYGIIGGDPEYRKKKWYEWWEKIGKYKKHPIINVVKSIKKPNFSKELAEFVGIVLGDGGITKNQVTITLHFKDDKEYSKFVIKLIKKLFKVPVSIYCDKKDSVIDLVVSRVGLVRYCVGKLGLMIGSKVKHQIDIPKWIKRNKSYLMACIRGLVDTDGCLFKHRYKVKGKNYIYKKLAFANRSRPLLMSVFYALRDFKMNPRLTKDGKDVRLESKGDVRKYFSIINSHNPKILKLLRN